MTNNKELSWEVWAVDALNALDSAVPRDEWIKILMAFKTATNGNGEEYAKNWSQIGYNGNNFEHEWKQAWNQKPKAVSAGSLWYLAEQAGWKFQNTYSEEEIQQFRKNMKAEREAARKKQAEEAANLADTQERKAKAAAVEWINTQHSTKTPNYLTVNKHFDFKAISNIGIGFQNDVVVIPASDIDGNIWNLQKIYLKPPINSNSENKFFHYGDKISNGKNSRVKGCMFTMGDFEHGKTILITTGLADQIALHKATGLTVVNAFNDGNIAAVYKELAKKYPEPIYTIVNCGDDDAWKIKPNGEPYNSGRETAAKLKCNSVFPQFATEHFTEALKPKDFWDLYHLQGGKEVGKQIAEAIDSFYGLPNNYHHRKGKLVHVSDVLGDDGEYRQVNVVVSGFIRVSARASNMDAEYFSILKFIDRQNIVREVTVPDEWFTDDKTLLKQLRRKGLYISTQETKKLINYLNECETNKWARLTNQTGWLESDFVYVTPFNVIGDGQTDIIFNGSTNIYSNQGLWSQNGTLEDWIQHIATPCQGNSRLLFALSAAFAPMLLRWMPEARGGFQLRGSSSEGKSVALGVAGSVWGGYLTVQTWYKTANALDKVAFMHNDALLCLDELKQAPEKEVGSIIYMISNGIGKTRSAASGAELQNIIYFRLIFLSTGEKTVQQILEAYGKTVDAGMEARMADFTANAGKNLGVFDCLGGFESGKDMAVALSRSCTKYYGTAAPAFLDELTKFDMDELYVIIKEGVNDFTKKYCPPDAEGQVHRVLERFALTAVAGELAIRFKILPFATGECERAVATCFQQWVTDRGGAGQMESSKIINHVIAFLLTHKNDLFYHLSNENYFPRRVVGVIKEDENGRVWFILPEIFRQELCKEFHYKVVLKTLADAGILVRPKSGRGYTRAESIPYLNPRGNVSVYRLEIDHYLTEYDSRHSGLEETDVKKKTASNPLNQKDSLHSLHSGLPVRQKILEMAKNGACLDDSFFETLNISEQEGFNVVDELCQENLIEFQTGNPARIKSI